MKRILYILLIMILSFINIFAAQEWDQDPDSRTYRAVGYISVVNSNGIGKANMNGTFHFEMDFDTDGDGCIDPGDIIEYRNKTTSFTTDQNGNAFVELFITVPINWYNGSKRIYSQLDETNIYIINNPNDETTTSFDIFPVYEVNNAIELASQFAPIMHFHENNPLFPMPIEAVYGYSNPILEDNYLGLAPLPVSQHTPESWKNLFNNTLLPKFNSGEFDKTAYFKIFEQDFNQYNSGTTSYLVIQYWYYYPFNTNANIHEGDWEHVSVMIDVNYNPIGIVLHKHYNLVSYAWENIYQKTNNRPHIYIGGKTVANIYTNWGIRLRTISSSNSPYTGYKEISGGAFNQPGWNDNANVDSRGFPPNLIDVNTYIDEYINPNRIESNYSLVHLNSLWWMGFEGKWGSSQEEILTDCNITITAGISNPLVFDGPIGPPFNVFYNNYEPADNIGEWQSMNLGTFSAAVIKFTVLSRSEVTLKVYKNGSPFYEESNVYDIGNHTIVFDQSSQGIHVNEGFVGDYKLTSNPNDNIFSFYYYRTD